MIKLIKRFFETGIELHIKQLELVKESLFLNQSNVKASNLAIRNETIRRLNDVLYIESRIEYLSSIERTPEQDSELKYYEKINKQTHGNTQN